MNSVQVLIAFGTVLLGSSAASASDSELTKCGLLPFSFFSMATVYDGLGSTYFIGVTSGNSAEQASFIKYNHSANTKETLWTFPSRYDSGSAVMNLAGDVYYFGGVHSIRSGYVADDIYIFRKNVPEPEVIQLPGTGRSANNAVVIGDLVYLFGGAYCPWVSSSCLKPFSVWTFNMTTNTIQDLADYPNDLMLMYTSAVYDGSHVYLFGGWHWKSYSEKSQIIMRFNPVTLEFIRLDVDLPAPVTKSTAFLVGDTAYIIGGYSYDDHPVYEKMITFNVKDYTMSEVSMEGFIGRSGTASTYIPEEKKAYVFGITENKSSYYTTQMTCLDMSPPIDCKVSSDGNYPHPENCDQFITCSNGVEFEFNCPPGLHFNNETKICDYPHNAKCVN